MSLLGSSCWVRRRWWCRADQRTMVVVIGIIGDRQHQQQQQQTNKSHCHRVDGRGDKKRNTQNETLWLVQVLRLRMRSRCGVDNIIIYIVNNTRMQNSFNYSVSRLGGLGNKLHANVYRVGNKIKWEYLNFYVLDICVVL